MLGKALQLSLLPSEQLDSLLASWCAGIDFDGTPLQLV